MSRYDNQQSKPWSLIVGITIVTASVWGIYAWKFSGQRPREQLLSTGLTQNTEPSGKRDSIEKESPLTSLRANLPTTPGHPSHSLRDPAWPRSAGELGDHQVRRSDLSSRARANSPATIGEPATEIAIDSASSDITAIPFTAKTAQAEISAGRMAKDRGDLIAARSAFSRVIDRGLASTQDQMIRNELAGMAEAMIFSRAIDPSDPLIGAHVVRGGENLTSIATQNKITAALLMTINDISDPNRIRAGSRLKIIHGPFDAVIWKSLHRLDVYLDGIFVRSYHVGLGTNGGTPVGRWIIKNKLINPGWTDPRNGSHYPPDDPDNPIGERWIGLKCVEGECLGRQGYGIHGTIDPESIGENLSMGCVRLVPEDVSTLYDLLVRHDSSVEIRP